MVVKTYEDVMNLKEGDECFIHHPINNSLVSCVYTEDYGTPYINPTQCSSCGLTRSSKAILADAIVNKTFRLMLPDDENY